MPAGEELSGEGLLAVMYGWHVKLQLLLKNAVIWSLFSGDITVRYSIIETGQVILLHYACGIEMEISLVLAGHNSKSLGELKGGQI
jgi:hypothetical protein